MKLSVKINDQLRKYYIAINEYEYKDRYVAETIDIPLRDYQEILRTNGAKFDSIYNEYFFERKIDAKKCIEILESHLVMNKLIE